ncbi:hypothetical protein BC828DRAFT_405530 [Blastocladiella britannica]|nr:hypothetical protein BC828DRAFT_405530 [Blastocladiella britannica]
MLQAGSTSPMIASPRARGHAVAAAATSPDRMDMSSSSTTKPISTAAKPSTSPGPSADDLNPFVRRRHAAPPAVALLQGPVRAATDPVSGTTAYASPTHLVLATATAASGTTASSSSTVVFPPAFAARCQGGSSGHGRAPHLAIASLTHGNVAVTVLVTPDAGLALLVPPAGSPTLVPIVPADADSAMDTDDEDADDDVEDGHRKEDAVVALMAIARVTVVLITRRRRFVLRVTADLLSLSSSMSSSPSSSGRTSSHSSPSLWTELPAPALGAAAWLRRALFSTAATGPRILAAASADAGNAVLVLTESALELWTMGSSSASSAAPLALTHVSGANVAAAALARLPAAGGGHVVGITDAVTAGVPVRVAVIVAHTPSSSSSSRTKKLAAESTCALVLVGDPWSKQPGALDVRAVDQRAGRVVRAAMAHRSELDGAIVCARAGVQVLGGDQSAASGRVYLWGEGRREFIAGVPVIASDLGDVDDAALVTSSSSPLAGMALVERTRGTYYYDAVTPASSAEAQRGVGVAAAPATPAAQVRPTIPLGDVAQSLLQSAVSTMYLVPRGAPTPSLAVVAGVIDELFARSEADPAARAEQLAHLCDMLAKDHGVEERALALAWNAAMAALAAASTPATFASALATDPADRALPAKLASARGAVAEACKRMVDAVHDGDAHRSAVWVAVMATVLETLMVERRRVQAADDAAAQQSRDGSDDDDEDRMDTRNDNVRPQPLSHSARAFALGYSLEDPALMGDLAATAAQEALQGDRTARTAVAAVLPALAHVLHLARPLIDGNPVSIARWESAVDGIVPLNAGLALDLASRADAPSGAHVALEARVMARGGLLGDTMGTAVARILLEAGTSPNRAASFAPIGPFASAYIGALAADGALAALLALAAEVPHVFAAWIHEAGTRASGPSVPPAVKAAFYMSEGNHAAAVPPLLAYLKTGARHVATVRMAAGLLTTTVAAATGTLNAHDARAAMAAARYHSSLAALQVEFISATPRTTTGSNSRGGSVSSTSVDPLVPGYVVDAVRRGMRLPLSWLVSAAPFRSLPSLAAAVRAGIDDGVIPADAAPAAWAKLAERAAAVVPPNETEAVVRATIGAMGGAPAALVVAASDVTLHVSDVTGVPDLAADVRAAFDHACGPSSVGIARGAAVPDKDAVARFELKVAEFIDVNARVRHHPYLPDLIKEVMAVPAGQGMHADDEGEDEEDLIEDVEDEMDVC